MLGKHSCHLCFLILIVLIFFQGLIQKYRELCDPDQERLEYYKAVNGLYGLFAWENGVEPFGIPTVQRQYIQTFKELTGIKVPYLSR